MPLEFFLTAQEIITARSARLSDEELLDHLKRLYADAGQLSGVLIDQTPGHALVLGISKQVRVVGRGLMR